MSDKTFDQAKAGTVLEENVSFEDFLVRYEGQRVEWHMGKVIQRVSNNETHQALQTFLTILFGLFLGIRNWVKSIKMAIKCNSMMANLYVNLIC